MGWFEKLLTHRSRAAKKMVSEWVEIFPDRCMICAYWRYGRSHGLTDKDTPSHTCTEGCIPVTEEGEKP